MTYEQTDPLTAAYARIKELEAEIAALKKQVPEFVWKCDESYAHFCVVINKFLFWLGTLRSSGYCCPNTGLHREITTKEAAEAHVRKLMENAE